MLQDSIYSNFYKAAELRLKTGESNLLEKTTAETQLMEAKNALMQNEANVEIYQLVLHNLTNSKAIVQTAENDLRKQSLNLSTDSASVEKNPQLAYLKQEVEISNKRKKLETSKTLPDFSIGYFNQSLTGFQLINGNEKYFGTANRFTGVQLGMAIPIWFVPQAAKIKAAGINQQVIQSNYEQNQLAVQSQYNQAIQDYLKNKNTLEYYEKNALPNAELIIKQSDKAYKNGEIGYMEYLLSLKNALGIKTNHLKSLYQYNQSIFMLEFLSGKN